MSDAPPDIQVQTQWAFNPVAVPVAANQIMVQNGPPTADGTVDAFYLIFGHVNPPMIQGVPGQPITQDMVRDVILPVSEVARVLVTADRLRDFAAQINGALAFSSK